MTGSKAVVSSLIDDELSRLRQKGTSPPADNGSGNPSYWSFCVVVCCFCSLRL